MRDDFDLTGKPVLLNVILRGARATDGTGRIMVFGFALNLPPDLMARSNGEDIHLVAECHISNAGTAPCTFASPKSPEDILEQGLPAFKSHPLPGEDPE